MIKKIENTQYGLCRKTIFFVSAAVLFCSGCGIVGLMGTPSSYEGKVPAEYNLAAQKGKKVLVLVEQPDWLSTEVNLRYYLTRAINESLTAKVKVRPKYIISYKELSELRSNSSDFSMLSSAEVGKALGADFVLSVVIQDYQLVDMYEETGYYSGSLSVLAALFDAAGGEKIWPEGKESRNVKVGFETGERGQEAAVDRLVTACAHCITRYLYNCPKYKFKTFDEGVKAGWDAAEGE